MADEELAPEGGEPEAVVASEEEAPQAPKSVEDFARERGWKPKDEFSGDETEWRDAETFIAFGMDRNQNLIKDVKSLREDMARMSRTTASFIESAAERARREERERWEAIHDKAVEDGDVASARRAVGEIAKIEATPMQPGGNDMPAALKDFASRNSGWFEKDHIMTAAAVAESNRLFAAGVTDHGERMQRVEQAMKEAFPAKFEKPKPPASVAAPAGRVANTAPKKKGFADMPAEAQQAAREMVNRKLIPNVDAYVEQFYEGAA